MSIFKKTYLSILQAQGFAFSVFIVLFAFFFFAGGLVVANGQTVGPSDSHIVNLFVDGQESVVPTRATTVGDLLDKAQVTLREGDLVEPVIETPINADNFRVSIYRASPVTIIDGSEVRRVLTPHNNAQLIAEKAGLTIYPEDKLTLNTSENFVQDSILGEKLTIDRATPLTLSLYGAPAVTYRSQASTVGELLAEKGIVPEQNATITPAKDTVVSADMAIFISKYGKQVVTVDETVAFATESTADPTQTIGTVTVVTKGVAGKKQVVYELSLRDGKEIGRTKIQEVVIEQPQKQVQKKGTKTPTVVTGDRIDWMRAAGISESDYFYVDYIVAHEGGWNGTTKANRAGSGAYGLCQALPATKMASAGADYMTNPVTQLKWCNGYAVGRYGSWASAYNFWIAKHWW